MYEEREISVVFCVTQKTNTIISGTSGTTSPTVCKQPRLFDNRRGRCPHRSTYCSRYADVCVNGGSKGTPKIHAFFGTLIKTQKPRIISAVFCIFIVCTEQISLSILLLSPRLLRCVCNTVPQKTLRFPMQKIYFHRLL